MLWLKRKKKCHGNWELLNMPFGEPIFLRQLWATCWVHISFLARRDVYFWKERAWQSTSMCVFFCFLHPGCNKSHVSPPLESPSTISPFQPGGAVFAWCCINFSPAPVSLWYTPVLACCTKLTVTKSSLGHRSWMKCCGFWSDNWPLMGSRL